MSGKDSMKNDFIGKQRFGKDIKISVPPTVLVTAMAKVSDVSKSVSSDFQKPGDLVFLLGKSENKMGGSELADSFHVPFNTEECPKVNGVENFLLYKKVYQAIQLGLLRSAHDCSDGGLLVALAESAIGGNLGLESDIEKIDEEMKRFGGSMAEFFFNESAGRFVVSVAPEKEKEFLKLFEGSYTPMGKVTEEGILRIMRHGLVILDTPLAILKKSWRGE